MTVRTAYSIVLIALALAIFPLAPAHADTLQDVRQLLKQGQHAQALDQANKYLAANPKDAQGRFLKGLILTEMNKTSEAIAVFQKLTEDYPELPEPYNNLAVIYAQQNQFDKAKQALEKAIQTHPSYATAYENLGDIYTYMASQAYNKALQINSSNTSAQTKLAMVRDLMSARPGASKSVAVAATSQPKPVEAKPVEAARSAEPPKPIETVKPTEPPTPETKPTAKDNGDTVTSDITRAVKSWAAAWSSKNVRSYLAHYAHDFRTPDGMSRSAWEAERAQRINKPGPITVNVDNLRVSIEGNDIATARFRQHYKSANLKTSSNKTLVLVRQNGKWLIQQERIGN